MNFQTPYDRNSYQQWFKSGFLPDDFLPRVEKVDFTIKTKYIRHAFLLGRCESLNLPVYEIHHSSDNDPRVSLAKEIFHFLADFMVRNALVLFIPANSQNYRLSYISIDLQLVDGRVQKQFSNPRRFSFFLGPNSKTHTPNEFLLKKGRVKDVHDLRERFSVEVVNKEFYNEIALSFTRLVGGSRKIGANLFEEKALLRLPSLPNNGPHHQKYQEFAVRLIGRLVFCWFLKKKSSPNGVPLISDDILSSQAVRDNDFYYHNILEYLFFQVLNTPQDERSDVVSDRFKDTPFLNGGLFEPHEDDFYEPDRMMGVTRHLNTLVMPDAWFVDLFTVFETFNFTIDENTTIDIELSIDPEMLGRIFENLLAEIDPITGETARKATGSYYTPRPIVEYMVDESLKHYLRHRTGLADALLDDLLNYSSDVQTTPAERDKIITGLDEIRVLDPACGSGAFPMGVLQKMLLILQKVDPKAEQAKRRLLQSILDPTLKAIIDKKISSHELWDYTRKLNIIRRSIYGVDIQPISVEISKLRFFLSLIVEEKVQDQEANRGIHALPNLEFKFVSADSLIRLHQQEDVRTAQADIFEDDFFDHFQKQVENYFSASSPQEKSSLRKTIVALINHKVDEKFELIASLSQFTPSKKKREERQLHLDTQTAWVSKWESYKNLFQNQTVKFFELRYFFPEIKDGFDIVIGNPPYVQLQKEGGRLAALYEGEDYAVFTRTGDMYCLFYERGRQLLRDLGCLCYITSNKWMRAGYGEPLRRFILEHTQPRILIDFGDAPIFANATTYTNILLFANDKSETADILTLDLSREKIDDQPLPALIERKKNEYVSDFSGDRFLIVKEAEMRLKQKIESQGVLLKDWEVKINYGIKTGLNEAFIIDAETKARLIAEDPKSAEIIKPILRGKDIKRYQIEFADLWLINAHNGNKEKSIPRIDIPKHYPAIYKHLAKYKEAAQSRDDQGDHWTNLRNCAYLEEFEKEKIVWLEISQRGDFYFDAIKYYIPNTAYLMTGPSIKYLLANLNSALYSYYFKSLTDEISGKSRRYTKQYVERICIKQVTKKESLLFEKFVEIIQSLRRKQQDSTLFEKQLDLMVYKLYNLSFTEVQIVDPDIDDIISRSEYDKSTLQTLADASFMLKTKK